MIELTKVTYSNIMSVGNYPITIELNRSHTTLIGGPNGTGKSTALLALVYGLYGKLLNNMKLEQAINSTNKKGLLVKVEFKKNGSNWLVVRGEKPKKFEIYKDDELLDQYAQAREQQSFLESVLGMDFKLFTQLVAINKERYIPFMEMNPADRRKIVEDILSIGVFSEMNEILKQDAKELSRLVSTKTNERSVLKTKQEGVQNLVKQIQSTISDSKTTFETELKTYKTEIEKLELEIETKQSQYDETLNEKVKELEQQLYEYEKLGTQFESKIKTYKKDFSFYEQNSVCPTCEQTISEELKNSKRDLAENKIAEINEAVEQMLEEVETVNTEYAKVSSLTSENEKVKSDIQALKTKLSFTQSSLKSIEKKLVDLESSNDQKTLEEQIALYEALSEQISGLEVELEEFVSIETLQTQMKELLKDDGVKALIVKDYNSIMNKKINEYLNSMGFFINMTIDENFNEKFHSMNKESFSYANLSTGQKTRLNLAITLALLEVASVKNSAVCNILWCDELLENLDSDGVRDAMNLFKEKMFSKNIFVVSQRYDEFLDMFHSSIRFKLNNGFTEIER